MINENFDDHKKYIRPDTPESFKIIPSAAVAGQYGMQSEPARGAGTDFQGGDHACITATLQDARLEGESKEFR
jgi:hypothetical protein